ncbi:MAG TPA: GGDEF domain-containing protein [Steroidobacteraceae bacterium]|nr:GGDEF domain-containing protein [Steroidobacteraceae bacterium]
MKLSLHSDQIASLLYRSTIHLRLPVLVAVWTIVVATLSVLVTALLLALLRGGANGASLVLAAAVAILITPPIAYKISQLMRELERSRTALQSLVRIDSLTGLANRRHFFQQAEQLLESALPPALPVSALMIDVDHFKSINDEAGHAAGDAVLSAVAQLLRGNIRAQDFIARYGGEEFAAMLPGADRDTAMVIAERMRLAVAGSSELARLAQQGVTISIGIAETTAALPVDAVMLAADRALYSAKAGGRNRCAFLEVSNVLSATARLRALVVGGRA